MRNSFLLGDLENNALERLLLQTKLLDGTWVDRNRLNFRSCFTNNLITPGNEPEQSVGGCIYFDGMR